jgi:small subunit ribosomal protein S10e
MPKHAETGCKNLEVWMLLRSLKDKNYVDLVYSW